MDGTVHDGLQNTIHYNIGSGQFRIQYSRANELEVKKPYGI